MMVQTLLIRSNKKNLVTPNIYRETNKNINGKPILKIETPKNGIANRAEG